jgi:hypothetical protein
MTTHSTLLGNIHSRELKNKLRFYSLLATWAMALVLLTAVSPPTWTGYDPVRLDSDVNSALHEASWVAGTAGGSAFSPESLLLVA